MSSVLRIRLIVWGTFVPCLVAAVVIGWRQWYVTGPTVFLGLAGYGYYFWLVKKAKASRQRASTESESERKSRPLL